MDIETYRAAEALLHSENILEKNIGEEEDVNMCKALEGIYQEGIEQGLNIAAEILKDMGLLNEEISQRLSEKLPQNVEKE